MAFLKKTTPDEALPDDGTTDFESNDDGTAPDDERETDDLTDDGSAGV